MTDTAATAKPPAAPWVAPLITAAVSALSGFAIAYLTFQTKSQEHAIQSNQIAAEQTKFDAEQKTKRDTMLTALIPKLVADDERDRKVALATLFVLMPAEASDILQRLQSALPQAHATDSSKGLAPALVQAAALAQASDTWVIVSGGDTSLAQAQHEQNRAQGNGQSATIYVKGGVFRTTIGPFPTQSDAQRANIAVRATLRSDAYVVNLKTWCPQSKDQVTHQICHSDKPE